jgi:putative PIN family toxin of toxin-antitoxin system
MGKKEETVKRVVLDTNVLVSALLFKGSLTKLVDLWRKEAIIPVISRETFEELMAVLHYSKFQLSADEIRALLDDEILPFFEVVEIRDKVIGVCRDPYDDMFLSVAVNAGASWIVTGAKDLLELGSYGEARIVTPKEFFRLISDP